MGCHETHLSSNINSRFSKTPLDVGSWKYRPNATGAHIRIIVILSVYVILTF